MVTALVVGNMIGSGIFLLPASLGPFGAVSIVGWLVSAAGATLIALVFARLSRIVRKSGGPYTFTREGFGDFPGFLVAWGYWISIWTTNAAIAVAFVSYLSFFWSALKTRQHSRGGGGACDPLDPDLGECHRCPCGGNGAARDHGAEAPASARCSRPSVFSTSIARTSRRSTPPINRRSAPSPRPWPSRSGHFWASSPARHPPST